MRTHAKSIASRRLRGIVTSFVCAAALGCDQPLAPPAPAPPTDTVAGQVIDADTGQPVGGAVVTIDVVIVPSATDGLAFSPDGVATSSIADDGGGFRLEPGVRGDWMQIQLSVRRDGFEPSKLTFKRTGRRLPVGLPDGGTPIDALVLPVYRTLVIRPGESIQTRVHVDHYNCGEFSIPCRRIVVDSAPSEQVEVELVPPTAPNNGLESGSDFGFPQYQRRVTLSGGGAVYIIGGSSPVTLTARRP